MEKIPPSFFCLPCSGDPPQSLPGRRRPRSGRRSDLPPSSLPRILRATVGPWLEAVVHVVAVVPRPRQNCGICSQSCSWTTAGNSNDGHWATGESYGHHRCCQHVKLDFLLACSCIVLCGSCKIGNEFGMLLHENMYMATYVALVQGEFLTPVPLAFRWLKGNWFLCKIPKSNKMTGILGNSGGFCRGTRESHPYGQHYWQWFMV